jgi:hypothetical protein
VTISAVLSILIANAGVPCPATAALEGPPTVTAPIARGLRDHGVSVDPSGPCRGRAVRAVVTSAAPAKGFKLHIEDTFGRTSDRAIATPETAVSLIESWVVDEESDLLSVGSPAADAATPTVVAVAAPVAAASRLRVYGGLGSLVGSDRSIWGGGALGACGQLGAVCVGLELGGARDLGLAGDTSDAGTKRWMADGLVTAGLPLSRGHFLLLPSLGVGGGWVRTHVAAEDASSKALSADTFGWRGKLAVLAGVAFSRQLGLGLEVAGLAAPGARGAPPEESSSQAANLPGEPRLSLRVSLGCLVSL